MKKEILDEALKEAKNIGIRNILALRGDPPRGQEYWIEEDFNDFNYAIDLVKYIRKNYGDYFCIGVAAYPEGHADGADTTNQNPLRDFPYLVEKVEAGADFIITQLFYDSSKFLEFEQMLINHPTGVFKSTPIIPGLMPINTYQSFLRAAKLSHASIPQKVGDDLESKVPVGDDEKVKEFGIDLLCDIISDIRTSTNNRVKGIHIYTLNLEKSTALILEQSGLLDNNYNNKPRLLDEEAIVDDDDEGVKAYVVAPVKDRKHRKSSVSTLNRVIVENPHEADNEVSQLEASQAVAEDENNRDTALAISSGEGALGREATWDDFPNGRFGNSRSPAYGEIDGYGPSLHVDNARALELWGYPVEAKDITQLFVRHIRCEIDVMPWSDQGLSSETSLIQEELLQLNEKGYWTVASQPAGNCIKSTDKMFGWGPPGGLVFQKAFIEFFVSDEEWKHKLKKKLDSIGDDVVSYYEGNCHSMATNGNAVLKELPNFSTNLAPDSSNAVTWGVFPNREILQSTIIEEESFLVWKDEAFSIWKEWQRLYHPKSPTSKLLQHIHDTYHLVSVVHHGFMNADALWEFLMI